MRDQNTAKLQKLTGDNQALLEAKHTLEERVKLSEDALEASRSSSEDSQSQLHRVRYDPIQP